MVCSRCALKFQYPGCKQHNSRMKCLQHFMYMYNEAVVFDTNTCLQSSPCTEPPWWTLQSSMLHQTFKEHKLLWISTESMPKVLEQVVSQDPEMNGIRGEWWSLWWLDHSYTIVFNPSVSVQRSGQYMRTYLPFNQPLLLGPQRPGMRTRRQPYCFLVGRHFSFQPV